MKVMAFTGMPFSGKSEAVHIVNELEIPVIRMGDLVWEEVKRQNLPLTDVNVGNIANSMRQKYGKDIWAKKTLEEIKKEINSRLIIIDGIRNLEEIKTFKMELGNNFTLIAIIASDEIRYMRGLSRNRADDTKDIDKMKERDLREINWGLKEVISSADIQIKNNGSIEEFRNNVKKILPML